MVSPPDETEEIRRELEGSHNIDEGFYPNVNMMDLPNGIAGEIESFVDVLNESDLPVNASNVAVCFKLKKLALTVIHSDQGIISDLESISKGRIGSALGADLILVQIIIGAAIVPFIATLSAQLAKDTYRVLKKKVRSAVENANEKDVAEKILAKILKDCEEELQLLIKEIRS